MAGGASRRPSVTGSTVAPPHDEQAEAELVGVLIGGGRRVGDLQLDAADFYVPRFAEVVAAVGRLEERGETVSVATVDTEGVEHLDRQALEVLRADAPSDNAATVLARRVVDLARRRRLQAAGIELQAVALNGAEPGRVAELAGDIAGLADTGGLSRRAGEIRSRLLTPAAVANLPEPGWLIEGYLPKRALVTLYGRPGTHKTFLALDWAASVATGTWWLRSHRVEAGPVVYVMAEGTGGLARRVAAWEAAHRLRLADWPIMWYPAAVNLLDSEWADGLAQVADDMGAALVVVDTLARSMPGGDENAAKDMTRLVDAVDRIRARAGATVLVVHHTPLDGSRLRGHSSLEAAVDTNLALEADGATLTLNVSKQKDASPVGPLVLHAHQAGGSLAIAVGRSPSDEVPTTALDVLRALHETDLGGGVTVTEWIGATSVPKRSFYRLTKTLIENDWCHVVSGEAGHRGARYTVTDQGKERLDA